MAIKGIGKHKKIENFISMLSILLNYCIQYKIGLQVYNDLNEFLVMIVSETVSVFVEAKTYFAF